MRATIPARTGHAKGKIALSRGHPQGRCLRRTSHCPTWLRMGAKPETARVCASGNTWPAWQAAARPVRRAVPTRPREKRPW